MTGGVLGLWADVHDHDIAVREALEQLFAADRVDDSTGAARRQRSPLDPRMSRCGMAIEAHVSTGDLPPPELAQALIEEAHERFAGNREGEVSRAYPALAEAAPDLFGICVVGTTGTTYAVGDIEHEFTIMSVSKPFVFALVCERLGPDEMRRRVGVNATGLPFNSVAAIESSGDGRTNPMVNSGAIATTSLSPDWEFLRDGLARFAGRELKLDENMYASAAAANARNREIARVLHERGRLYCDPDDAVDRYRRQCLLDVNAYDLAVMAATLADGGVNPLTGERVVDASVCHYTLAVMLTAGLYETSGDWLYDVGLPAKSGIGGGIVTISPGKGGMGTFAPRLDGAGNSVKGRLAARFLSQRLGMDLLISAPAGSSAVHG
jgi:glutaminase